MKTQPRRRPENVKQQVVEAREFEDIRLVKEHVAEFRYRPAKCQQGVSGRGRVEGTGGLPRARRSSSTTPAASSTSPTTEEKSAEEIVFDANDRCNQENLLPQLKGGVRSLTAPVDNLLSNWAYMVMGSLAWSLKAWAALMLPEEAAGRSGTGRRNGSCCGWTSPRFGRR